jgi:hypothetical protein
MLVYQRVVGVGWNEFESVQSLTGSFALAGFDNMRSYPYAPCREYVLNMDGLCININQFFVGKYIHGAYELWFKMPMSIDSIPKSANVSTGNVACEIGFRSVGQLL